MEDTAGLPAEVVAARREVYENARKVCFSYASLAHVFINILANSEDISVVLSSTQGDVKAKRDPGHH